MSSPSALPGASHNEEIVSSRVLDAPRDRVFRAFTDPALLAGWWGPEGFTNTFHFFDPRPGGEWRFTMRGPDGAEYSMEKVFEEVAAPERIVVRHVDPVHAHRLTMTFAEAGEGRTELTWRMRFDWEEEFHRVKDFIAGANEQNLDRLQALLARPGGANMGPSAG